MFLHVLNYYYEQCGVGSIVVLNYYYEQCGVGSIVVLKKIKKLFCESFIFLNK